MTDQPHILVITEDPCGCKEPCDCESELVYSIECPGVTDSCRTWWECFECRDALAADEDGAYEDQLYENSEAHGVEHQHLACGWAAKSQDCWGQSYDYLDEAARDAFGADAKPGRYPVELGADDEYLTLRLLAEAVHD